MFIKVCERRKWGVWNLFYTNSQLKNCQIYFAILCSRDYDTDIYIFIQMRNISHKDGQMHRR